MNMISSTPLADATAPPTVDAVTRRLGLVCLVGGLSGILLAAAMLAIPPMVAPDRFSYPFNPAGHIVAETVFALQHLTMLAGVAGLARLLGARSRTLRAGLVITGLGVIALIGCELLAITAAWEPMSSPWATTVGSGYGVAMLLLGVGPLICGTVIARRRLLAGWARWVTLLSGGYVFAVLFPAVFGPMVAGRVAIGVWLVLWGGIGWAVWRGRTAEF